VAEGENVTESQYFKSFQKQNSRCNIRIILAKHITDPEGMLKAVQLKWRELELDARKGDKAYVVLDLDCDENKAALIKRLQLKSKEVQFIVSNPCFEVWFLLHFKYSTKEFLSGNAVVHELRNYISEYEKNLDVSGMLAPLQDKAFNNVDKLIKYFDEMGYKWPSIECNPRTDAGMIVDVIKE